MGAPKSPSCDLGAHSTTNIFLAVFAGIALVAAEAVL